VHNINQVADVHEALYSHDATMNQQQAIAVARRIPGTQGTKARASSARIGPVAGLTGLACYTAGSLIAALPRPGSATSTVTAHLAASRGSVLGGLALMFLALPFLLVFLGFLINLLAEAEGRPWLLTYLSAAAWLALLMIVAAGVLPVAAVTWQGAAASSPDTVRLAIDMTNLSQYALSAPVAAASVLAPTIVVWRTRALTRWLAGLAVIEVAANAAELAGLSMTKGADAGGYSAGVGPIVWVLWAAALAVTALAVRPTAAGQRVPADGTPPAVTAS
jgi:hypothetical protein